MVAAGALVNDALARAEATSIPVDSEHSAIFQCLVGRRTSGSRSCSLLPAVRFVA